MDFFNDFEMISQGSNWFSHLQQNDPHKMMEISPFDSFFDEFNTTPQLQYESKKLSYFNEFDDLENFNFDFNLPPLDEHFEVDQKPLNMLPPESSVKTESQGFVASLKKEFEVDNEEGMQLASMALPLPLPSGKKKRSSNALELDEIKKHFDVPISVAAKKMNVGLTHLKKRCRELKIMRWPRRKLKSLDLLTNNLKNPSYVPKQISNEFDDLENFNFDFNLPPLDEHFEVDQKPLNMPPPESSVKTESQGFVALLKKEFEVDNEEGMQLASMALPLPLPSGKKKRSSNALELDEIKKHFDVPISVAAKKMNVGLTHLKKRCRELKIMRWPRRKLKSLDLLTNNLKERGLANEVVMLEKQKKMLEKLPSMELNQEIKKLRQSCFNANYKRQKFTTL